LDDADESGPDLKLGVDVSDVPAGAMFAGTVDGEAILLINDAGAYCAVSGECTHLGAPLKDGMIADGQLRCPWHHARFSLRTGEAVAAPAFEPLKRFQVEQRAGRLFVSRRSDSQPLPSAESSQPRVVIIGGGAAGHACAEMLARSGFGGAVTVISDDADPPYDRTFCSKQYLIGLSSREDCALPAPQFKGEKGLTMRLGQSADTIGVATKTVTLSGGDHIAFDVLVLATGSEPKRPDIPGLKLPNVHVMRTLRDADSLIATAQAGKKAAIIGASFIGLEVAASLIQRKLQVAVIAPDDIPLKKIVGPDVGKMIRAVHEEKGVRFHLGRHVTEFDGRSLKLDDGSALDAHLVVLGVGVTPRTKLAAQAGIAVASDEAGGGVLVNERLESSVPGIYAIGDVARYPDQYAGKPIRVEHWVHAQRQGQHVARTIMGCTGPFADLPFFWSAHFDTGLLHLGHVDKIATTVVKGSVEDRSFVIRFAGKGGEEALVTCNQDYAALTVEADWESGFRTP
jgi:NADPH-dependent 2,4-dienoyl-CoA reductase/sulfur reductase-like enzyme/nitrite reductase/ring-hydroxylating ferredoxin subunit